MKTVVIRGVTFRRVLGSMHEDHLAEAILRRWANHGKEYAARITGRHPKFNLNREFAKIIDRNWSRSGKQGTTTVEIKKGIYEIQSPDTGLYESQSRFYVLVGGRNEIRQISAHAVRRYSKRLPVIGG